MKINLIKLIALMVAIILAIFMLTAIINDKWIESAGCAILIALLTKMIFYNNDDDGDNSGGIITC